MLYDIGFLKLILYDFYKYVINICATAYINLL